MSQPWRRALPVSLTLASLACGSGGGARQAPGEASSDSMPAAPTMPDTGRTAGAPTASDTLATARAAGTAPAAPHDSAGNRTGQTTVRGKVVVTGTTGTSTVVLVPPDGKQVFLAGDPAGELRALAGAEVQVQGVPTSGFPGPALLVAGYEVLSINGEQPHVGVILVRADTIWLAGSTDTLRVIAAPPSWTGRAGAHVWITGPVRDGTLQVQSYGVIRDH